MKKVAGLLIVLTVFAVASGLAFADTAGEKQNAHGQPPCTDVNFTARLHFDSAMDDHVQLELTNY